MRKALLLILLLFSAWPLSLRADEGVDPARFEGFLNKLLAPGPLVWGHEHLEHKDCLKCHEPGGGVPQKNCFSCHTKIEDQRQAKTNFHGLMGNKNCVDCHKEHKGRDAKITPLDPKSFDHSRTGFTLDGAHKKVDCAECHTSKRSDRKFRKDDPKYFGQVNSCLACHKKDDPHFFEGKFKGKECSTCHTTETWKNSSKFDHQRETGYALLGDHAQLACTKCHVKEGKDNIKYKWPQIKTQKCLSCHTDQHKQNLSPRFQGGQCATCHTQTEWTLPNFNHNVTGFVIQGGHTKVACVDCHKDSNQGRAKKDFVFRGLQKTCSSCHTDFHGFGREIGDRFGGPLQRCENCHTENSWKGDVRFNHENQTRFPITGKHQQNQCFDCHKAIGGKVRETQPNTLRRYFFKGIPNKTCESCHTSPHPKSFHQRFKNIPCQQCHTTDGWNVQNMQGQIAGNPTFHNKTRFPLTGSHQKLSCKSCHVVNGRETYKFPSVEKNFCVDCHKTPHERQFTEVSLNKSCASCHTTVNFSQRPTFDHDTTGFKLIGEHKKIEQKCVSCHLPTKERLPLKIPKVAHNFKFNKNKDANLCANCHASPHRRQFSEDFLGKSCATCHTPNGFKQLLAFDHAQTGFKLDGAHGKLKQNCFECHKPANNVVLQSKPPRKGRLFQFPGENKGYCENCHINEHKKMFDPEFASKPCLSCHTTDTFEKRKSFDHNETNFQLKGKHLKVKCAECHTPTKERYTQFRKAPKGKYDFPNMKEKSCATCHTDPHKGSNGPKCSSCHNEQGWKNAQDFHKDMQLVGVHLQLSCKSCHGENARMLKGSSQECTTCHIKDDNHNGSLPQCGTCHLQNFWNQTSFDHNLTRFPLQGAHRVTDCRSCHNQGVYKGLPTDCRGCHAAQAAGVQVPPHASPRYFQCARCHNTFSFPGASP